MGKIKENTENDDKQKLLITQDMKLVKALAGNEKKIRDRALRNLKEWFKQRSSKMPFTEDDYLRIWKGLFCSMWMSDKLLVQEECAENIAGLIHFVSEDSALLFFKCGLKLMSIEWFGIDQWRLDKFLMLARRMLRQAFDFLKKNDWKLKLVREFTRSLSQTILISNNKCTGLTMHVIEIYLEELAKMSKGKISTSLVMEFLKPFVRYLSTSDDDRQIKHTIKCMFHHLMQQSDVGLEHEAKFAAWKKEGFRGGHIDVMEKMEVDGDDTDDASDDDDERELDPRAGHVNVLLPQLKFDTQSLLQLFKDFKFKKDSTTRGRKALTQLHQQFEKLLKGSYPLGVTTIPQLKKDDSTTVDTSIDRLIDFEQKLRHEKKQFNEKLMPKKKPKIAKPKKLNGFDSNIFADKLNEFINRSEGNLRVKKNVMKKRRRSALDPNWSYEASFKRNSGLWTVHRLNTTVESPVISNGVSPVISNGVTPVEEWNRPLETGETEIFVPSQKFKEKLKAEGQDINEVVNKIMRTPNLVKNPFASTKIPKSEKKVRIALKFNQSQEIHEHVAQLKSSPGIPFDANKKPEKPLLKPNFVKSPINPFYKKKLKDTD